MKCDVEGARSGGDEVLAGRWAGTFAGYGDLGEEVGVVTGPVASGEMIAAVRERALDGRRPSDG